MGIIVLSRSLLPSHAEPQPATVLNRGLLLLSILEAD